MIDPSIALSYRPQTQAEPPMQQMGNMMSLANMAGQMKQRDAETTALTQENQQRQIALQQQSVYNKALADNTKTGPDGKATIDEDGVISTLNKNGAGQLATKFQQDRAQLHTHLQQLDNEKLDNLAKTQDMTDSKLGTVLGIKDPAKKQAAWTTERNWAIATMHQDPNALPETVPGDDELQTMLARSASGRQAVQLEINRRKADADDKRADASEKRTEAYQEKVLEGMDQNRYQWKGDVDANRHPLVLDTRTGRVTPNSNVTLPPDAVGAGRGRGLTANGEAVEGRFETKQINDARSDLDEIHTQRTTLGNALNVKKGKDFINPLTKKSETMDDETRATLEEQFNNVTNRGKRIMRQWGGKASNGVIGANEFTDNKPDSSATTPQNGGAKEPLVYVPGKGVIPKSQAK